MSDKKKHSIREHISMIVRGIKILVEEYGYGMFLSNTLRQIVQSTRHLPNIYLSALVINEIAGKCRQHEVTKLAIIAVLVNALVQLIKSLLDRWYHYYVYSFWESIRNVYAKKMFDMDYIDADNVKNHELHELILQNTNQGGAGLIKLYFMLPLFIGGVARTIGAAAMTVSLFVLKVDGNSAISFINSPFISIIVIALMLAAIFIPPYLEARAEKARLDVIPNAVKANTKFAFYVEIFPVQKERAKDIRMYKQEFSAKAFGNFSIDKLYKKYTEKYMESTIVGQIIKGVFNIFVYAFVALKSLLGSFGVGSIAMYVGAITQFSEGISTVVNTFTELAVNNNYLDYVYQYLDIPNKMYQGTLSTEKRSDCKYDVEFRNVSFKYPDAESYALRDINISFNAGERVAVVGMNGSGKTTFIKLLCRLYDPTDGEVIMNDFNARKFDYKQYLDIFSVVFQDFKLLPFTLGENVAASMTYDRAKAEQCLRFVGFGDRLDEMENGLDTFLYKDFDSSGVEISGGEAQKIALARALYKDAPFIILDEPTAALDPLAEYEIYTKFNEIAGTKTAIYISHRLSSCRFCERILVFDEGRIVEEGSHDELLSRKGKYHELWYAQAQYYDN